FQRGSDLTGKVDSSWKWENALMMFGGRRYFLVRSGCLRKATGSFLKRELANQWAAPDSERIVNLQFQGIFSLAAINCRLARPRKDEILRVHREVIADHPGRKATFD